MKKKGAWRMQKRRAGKRQARFIPFILLLGLFLAAGCSGPRYGGVIDWVDFVMTEDSTYTAAWNAVLRDPDSVTDDVVATVKKKLDENVHDSAYRSKPGDAAFLKKGTKLYRVKGFAPEDLVAVRDERQIGGYKLYVSDDYDGLPPEEFKSILRAPPDSVSIYRLNDVEPMRVASSEEGKRLTEMLRQAVYTPDYRPDRQEDDPLYYQVVFDTGEPVLYTFGLTDDGKNILFRESYKAEEGIREYLTSQP